MRDLRKEEHEIIMGIAGKMNDLIEDREAFRTTDLMALAYMLVGICERIEEDLPIDDEAYLFKARMIAAALAEEDLKRWERYWDQDGTAARTN